VFEPMGIEDLMRFYQRFQLFQRPDGTSAFLEVSDLGADERRA